MTHLPLNAGRPDVTLRHYYSARWLAAAKAQCAEVRRLEDALAARAEPASIQHEGAVLLTVHCSVAFLEASINEFFVDVIDNEPPLANEIPSPSHQPLKDFWEQQHQLPPFPGKTKGKPMLGEKWPALLKYQQALNVRGLQTFDVAVSPYKDVALLVEVRNSFTHYKPKSFGGPVVDPLARKLAGLFPLTAVSTGAGNPTFPDKMLGAGLAEWALRNALELANEFYRRQGATSAHARGGV